MKKIFTSVLLTFILFNFSFADKVDDEKARKVAIAHLSQVQDFVGSINLDLAQIYNTTIQSAFNPNEFENTPLLYIYNIGDNNGIILVSGDDVASPILGYTMSGSFDINNLPYNFKKWIEGYKSQIRYAVENELEAEVSVKELWVKLINGDISSQTKSNASVGPLCTTTWNQSPYYNAQCPGGSVTGCVATAMAQVMKFWNHPAQGTGMHSYNHDTYGTLSANFGGTSYQWASMPGSISGPNDAIATLMYHCGVSVDMDYSPESSGAWVIENDKPVCSESALKNYFGYSSSLHGEERDNYTTSQWTNMLRADINAGRPLVYAGFGSGGGHAFVCDGYNDGDFFHFNWGWGSYYDGFFHIDALDPGGTGTGGGTGGYNSGHQAIFGVVPETTTSTSDLRLYNQSISVTPNTISLGQGFSVSADIGNFGQYNFTGEFAAFIFDNNGNVIDDVQTFSGTIITNEWNTLTFVTEGISTLLPGSYTISVYFKPPGEDWIRVGNGDYSNTANLLVANESDIELYSDMIISCGTTITNNQAFHVSVDIANYGSSTFYGTVDISIYDLEGYFVETIETLSGVAFDGGYYYEKVFSTNGINVEPGSYLLALLHKPDGGDWTLSGSTLYPNPIQVIVRAPGETLDIYEPNDSESSAENLTVNFSGNNASVYTTGSNSHSGIDYDYYNINLPSGYDYTIVARAHDSYNSGNGQTYTNDVVWSYKSGAFWSIAIDDVMNGNINVYNGGTVMFHAAPYFLGETGTYLLDIQIVRMPLGIDDNENFGKLVVYPVPVVDVLNLNITDNVEVNKIQIMDISGKTILIIDNPVTQNNKHAIPVENFDAGTYVIIITTDSEVFHNKFIKK